MIILGYELRDNPTIFLPITTVILLFMCWMTWKAELTHKAMLMDFLRALYHLWQWNILNISWSQRLWAQLLRSLLHLHSNIPITEPSIANRGTRGQLQRMVIRCTEASRIGAGLCPDSYPNRGQRGWQTRALHTASRSTRRTVNGAIHR